MHFDNILAFVGLSRHIEDRRLRQGEGMTGKNACHKVLKFTGHKRRGGEMQGGVLTSGCIFPCFECEKPRRHGRDDDDDDENDDEVNREISKGPPETHIHRTA